MLLNTAKYEGYSFYRFCVIKRKPTGGGGRGGVKLPPPRLGLRDFALVVHKIFRETNISYLLITPLTSEYQGVRNVFRTNWRT